ncbi:MULTISPECIES: RICIN domain-containing protein [unclassified Streptomyces]|uniref:RICIN domain-containing protein n=1 Tax=unclassified Streptomyces TaxID=2593676 RepID=UPI002E765042|nr:RICIN domain-containing protein [Streptomyces sp. JV176]MEE1799650.1 RICIN domain-containing protein [Streptomyces sp. JV176]
MRAFACATLMALPLTTSPALAGPVGSALRAPVTDGQKAIKTFAGLCFDVPDDNLAPGTPIVQDRCDSGASQSMWVTTLSDGKIEIKNFDGLCLDVSGSSALDRTPIVQNTCDRRASQKFTPRADGDNIELRTAAGKCLDVLDGSTALRAAIVQNKCQVKASQRFLVWTYA